MAGDVQGAEASVSTNAPPVGSQPHADELTWLTNFKQTQAQAKRGRKFVLLFFHGSDWCPVCTEVQRQVFDSAAFVQYARKMLVLVDVDFPEKHQQNEELKQANLALKTRFNLSREPGEGFSTLVLLNESGETVFRRPVISAAGWRSFCRNCNAILGLAGQPLILPLSKPWTWMNSRKWRRTNRT